MDVTDTSLQPILILLAAAVLAVAACRLFALPPIVGYLSVGGTCDGKKTGNGAADP